MHNLVAGGEVKNAAMPRAAHCRPFDSILQVAELQRPASMITASVQCQDRALLASARARNQHAPAPGPELYALKWCTDLLQSAVKPPLSKAKIHS